jgi:hypothetical protein
MIMFHHGESPRARAQVDLPAAGKQKEKGKLSGRSCSSSTSPASSSHTSVMRAQVDLPAGESKTKGQEDVAHVDDYVCHGGSPRARSQVDLPAGSMQHDAS